MSGIGEEREGGKVKEKKRKEKEKGMKGRKGRGRGRGGKERKGGKGEGQRERGRGEREGGWSDIPAPLVFSSHAVWEEARSLNHTITLQTNQP